VADEGAVSPDEDDLAEHDGPSNDGDDTDNRPPYYTVAFIMKT
jgi:hypothetical protein